MNNQTARQFKGESDKLRPLTSRTDSKPKVPDLQPAFLPPDKKVYIPVLSGMCVELFGVMEF